MKSLLVAAAMLTLFAPSAFAQSQAPGSQSNSTAQGSTHQSQNMVAAQKIKQDLQNAGFSDVKVVAETFVVQAKSKDGDPVLMTIGPHGMSLFETTSGGSSSSSGSNSNSTTGSSNGTSSGSQK